jgi:hypothetical protein
MFHLLRHLYFFLGLFLIPEYTMSSLGQLKKEAACLKIRGRGRMKKADLAVAIALAKQSAEGGSMVGGAARTTTAPSVGARMQRRLPLDAHGGSMVGGSIKGEKPFLCDCCAANLHGAGLFDFMSKVSKGIRTSRSSKPVTRTAPRVDGWAELKKLVSPSDWKTLLDAVSSAGLDGQEGTAAIVKYLSGEGSRLLKLPAGVVGLQDYEWYSDIRNMARDVSNSEYAAFKNQLKPQMAGGGLARKMKHMAAAQPMAPVFNSGDLESFIGRGKY